MRVDLRAERERRGLSLAQVAASCRIPQRYLEALESGQRQDLPKGPFLESYQRQYLAYLGLPADAELSGPPLAAPSLAPASPAPAPRAPAPVGPAPRGPASPAPAPRGPAPVGPAARPAAPPRPAPADASAAPTDEPPSQVEDPPSVDPQDLWKTRTITRQYDSVPVVRLVLAGFLVTMTLVLGMKVLSGIIDRASAPSAPDPEGGVTTVVVKSQAPTAPEPAAPTLAPADPAPAADPAAEPAAVPAGDPAADPAAADPLPDGVVLGEGQVGPLPGMRVHLRAHEPVKVAVELDGSTVFSGTLQPGEGHDFHGEERIALDVADLTRLAIHYDGQRVDPLGNLAQPRRLVFLRGEE